MTDLTSNASVMLDPPLAALLSRLAGLLGQAVPVHRFGMMAQTPEGAPKPQNPTSLQCMNLNTNIFNGSLSK